MKILKCIPCNKQQKEGLFCLTCGQPLKEVITSTVEFKKIDTARSTDTLKRDIRRWLTRIGCQQPEILIANTGGTYGSAEVEYILGGKTYTFSSTLQIDYRNNLAAVEQFLHHRVLGIERGIESTNQAFAGYEALPDPNTYLQAMSDQEIRKELKQVHPDTGTGNKDRWDLLMAEKNRRKMKL